MKDPSKGRVAARRGSPVGQARLISRTTKGATDPSAGGFSDTTRPFLLWGAGVSRCGISGSDDAKIRVRASSERLRDFAICRAFGFAGTDPTIGRANV